MLKKNRNFIIKNGVSSKTLTSLSDFLFFIGHLNSFEELAKLNFDSKVCFKEFLLPLEEHFSHSPIVMVLKEVNALFLRIC